MKNIYHIILMLFALFCMGCEKGAEPSGKPSEVSIIYGYAINKTTNAPIQGALITLMPNAENRYTGSDGTYQFNNLPINNRYTLTADADGFGPGRKDVLLKDNNPLEVTFVLEPKG